MNVGLKKTWVLFPHKNTQPFGIGDANTSFVEEVVEEVKENA